MRGIGILDDGALSGEFLKKKTKAGKVFKTALLAGICAVVGLPGWFSCARNNPLDDQADNFIPGKKPEARFLRDSVVAYIKNDVAIPVFYHDSSAGGGRAPRVTALLLNWAGGGALLDDTVTPPENDTLVRRFSEGMASYIYLRALDNDNMQSPPDSLWLRIDEGKPRILSLSFAPQRPYVNDTVTLTARATDDNAEKGASLDFIWQVDTNQDTTARSGILQECAVRAAFSTAGIHRVLLRVRDKDLQESPVESLSISVSAQSIVVDTAGPEVSFIMPMANDTVNAPRISVVVETKDQSSVSSVSINSKAASLVGGAQHRSTWISDSVVLAQGGNTLSVSAVDIHGKTTLKTARVTYSITAEDRTPPVIMPLSPKAGDTVYFPFITVTANVVDASGRVDAVTCNSLPMTFFQMSTFSADSIAVDEGLDTIILVARDDKGNQALLDVPVYYKKNAAVDTSAPSVLILSPRRGVRVEARACTVSVAASDPMSGIDSVSVNGLRALHAGGQLFVRAIRLDHGANPIIARAIDKSGNNKADTGFVFQNAAPVFDLSQKDTAMTVGAEASFCIGAADPDNDSLAVSFLTIPSKATQRPHLSRSGNAVTVAPYTPDRTGVDSFSILVTDTFATFDTVTFRVFISSPQETKPFFTTGPGDLPDSAVVGVPYAARLIAVDPNRKTLALSFKNPPTPQGAQIDSAGRVAWTPAAADTGTDSLFALVSNGTESDTLIWAVRVIMPNLPPRLADPADTAIYEGQALNIALRATDPNNDNLSYSMASFPAGAQLSGDTFIWMPTFKQAGAYTILFRVRETDRTEQRTDSQTVTVTVRNVNHAPVLAPVGAKTVVERATLVFTLSASDTNGDSVGFSLVNPPQGATLKPQGMTSATFLWTPSGTQSGSYSVRFIASDNGIPVMGDTGVVTITVRDTAPPAFETLPDSLQDTVFVSGVYLDTLKAKDPYGDTLMYRKLTGPAWLSVTTAGEHAVVSGSPLPSDVTAGVAVSVTVEDPFGCQDTLSWTITVMPLWPRVWGAPGTQDTGFSVIETGSGYALCGNIAAPDQNTRMPFLLRSDKNGNPLSYKLFAGTLSKQSVYSLAQAADGGYVMCGAESSAVAEQLVLLKANVRGDNLEWTAKFTVSSGIDAAATRGVSICATREGGFAACGTATRRGGTVGATLPFFVKTNSAGKEEWQKEYANAALGNSAAYCVVQTTDDGYLLCGEAASKGDGQTDTDVLLIKTDAKGDTLWTRTFNLGVRDIGMSVQQVGDGYLVGGYTVSGQSSAKTGFVMKISEKGDILWTRPVTSASGNLSILSIRKLFSSNDFIAAGSVVNSDNKEDAMLIKFTADGKGEEWRKMYGGTLPDGANAVAALQTGGFVFTGFITRTQNSLTSTDIYLLKTDSEGNVVEKPEE
jgi:hypothetical protein